MPITTMTVWGTDVADVVAHRLLPAVGGVPEGTAIVSAAALLVILMDPSASGEERRSP